MIEEIFKEKSDNAYLRVYNNTLEEHMYADCYEQAYNMQLDRYEHLVVKVRKLDELPKNIIKSSIFIPLGYGTIVTAVHGGMALLFKSFNMNPSIIIGNIIGCAGYWLYKRITDLMDEAGFYERQDIRWEYNKLSKDLKTTKQNLINSYEDLLNALKSLKKQLQTYKSSVNMISESDEKIISSTEEEITSELNKYTLKLQKL